MAPAPRLAARGAVSSSCWKRWLGCVLIGLGLGGGFAGNLFAAEVKLAWDPSPDPDVTNYRVYWGYQSRTYTSWFSAGNVTNATVGSLVAGTRYFFTVTAVTDDGRESEFSNEVEYTPPLPPPAAPVVEVRSGTNPWEVQLAWSASTDSRVTGYRVCWGTQSGNYSARLDVGKVTTTTIGSLAAGTTYYFAVLALTSDGQQSAYSNEVNYTTPWPPPPAPLVELRPGANPWEVRLVWPASTDARVTCYRVYWGTRSRSYSAALDVGHVTSTTLSGLAAGTSYYFAVVAVADDGQQSALSNEVSYNTPLPPLAVPVLELRAGNAASEAVLAWMPIQDPNVNNYRVYWGTRSRTYTAAMDVGNVASATVRSLVAGTIYFFAVTATSSDGRESAWSNEISYTVPLPPPEPPVLSAQTGSNPGEVNLTWTPSLSPDVVHYRIYWGGESGTYTDSLEVGKVTAVTLNSLAPGATYFFAATALTSDSRESARSNEVEYTVPAPPLVQGRAEPPVLLEVTSRLSHRAAGPFELPVNLAGPPTVEGRFTSSLELVFRFDKPVVAAAARVSRGVGTVSGSPIIQGAAVSVMLTGVASRQWLSVSLTDVTGENGVVLNEAGVTLGILGGDVNGDGVITSVDAELVRVVSGQLTHAGNYRADVNLSGTLSSADFQAVRMRAGHRLPAY